MEHTDLPSTCIISIKYADPDSRSRKIGDIPAINHLDKVIRIMDKKNLNKDERIYVQILHCPFWMLCARLLHSIARRICQKTSRITEIG